MRALGPTLLLVLLPLLAAAVALGAYLNYASVRNSYLSMVSERHETVATRIARDAEVAMSMGLPLAGQDALVRSLAREREVDPLIASVDVVALSGRVLHSSDADRAGGAISGETEAMRVAAPVQTAFDTVEGQVVVRADRMAIEANLSELASGILRTAIIVFLAAAALVTAAVVLAVRALEQRLSRRGTAVSGETIPSELLPVIGEIDRAHAGVGDRLTSGGAR
jgi:hypothetical protein